MHFSPRRAVLSRLCLKLHLLSCACLETCRRKLRNSTASLSVRNLYIHLMHATNARLDRDPRIHFLHGRRARQEINSNYVGRNMNFALDKDLKAIKSVLRYSSTDSVIITAYYPYYTNYSPCLCWQLLNGLVINCFVFWMGSWNISFWWDLNLDTKI